MRTPLTFILVAANVILFVAQLAVAGLTEALSLTPSLAFAGAYWQFLTYMFMHAGPVHIFFNMLVLFIFGLPVEGMLGARRFALLYIISGIGSALLYIGLTMFVSPLEFSTLMLGASGAVFAVLTAYGFLFPRNIVWIPPGLPLPAWLAVVVFAFLEFFLGLTGLDPGVANFGHLGGIATGALMMLWWKRCASIRYAGKELRNFEFVWE